MSYRSFVPSLRSFKQRLRTADISEYTLLTDDRSKPAGKVLYMIEHLMRGNQISKESAHRLVGHLEMRKEAANVRLSKYRVYGDIFTKFNTKPNEPPRRLVRAIYTPLYRLVDLQIDPALYQLPKPVQKETILSACAQARGKCKPIIEEEVKAVHKDVKEAIFNALISADFHQKESIRRYEEAWSSGDRGDSAEAPEMTLQQMTASAYVPLHGTGLGDPAPFTDTFALQATETEFNEMATYISARFDALGLPHEQNPFEDITNPFVIPPGLGPDSGKEFLPSEEEQMKQLLQEQEEFEAQFKKDSAKEEEGEGEKKEDEQTRIANLLQRHAAKKQAEKTLEKEIMKAKLNHDKLLELFTELEGLSETPSEKRKYANYKKDVQVLVLEAEEAARGPVYNPTQ